MVQYSYSALTIDLFMTVSFIWLSIRQTVCGEENVCGRMTISGCRSFRLCCANEWSELKGNVTIHCWWGILGEEVGRLGGVETIIVRANIGILARLLMICNKQRLRGWWVRSRDQHKTTIFAHENFTISSDGCQEWPAFTWVGLKHSIPFKF